MSQEMWVGVATLIKLCTKFQHSTNSIFMQPKLIHVDLNVLILVSLHARLPDTSVVIVKIHTFAEVDQSLL